jgi:hypothetical protein
MRARGASMASGREVKIANGSPRRSSAVISRSV